MSAPGVFRQWLIRKLGGTVKVCTHRWFVLIENYPSYAYDMWQCRVCGFTKNFPNDEPPEPIKTEICDLGGVHIVNGR